MWAIKCVGFFRSDEFGELGVDVEPETFVDRHEVTSMFAPRGAMGNGGKSVITSVRRECHTADLRPWWIVAGGRTMEVDREGSSS